MEDEDILGKIIRKKKDVPVKENFFCLKQIRWSKTLLIALYFCGLWIVTWV